MGEWWEEVRFDVLVSSWFISSKTFEFIPFVYFVCIKFFSSGFPFWVLACFWVILEVLELDHIITRSPAFYTHVPHLKNLVFFPLLMNSLKIFDLRILGCSLLAPRCYEILKTWLVFFSNNSHEHPPITLLEYCQNPKFIVWFQILWPISHLCYKISWAYFILS